MGKGLAVKVLVVGALLLVAIPNIAKSYQDPWPKQRHMLQMANYLDAQPVKGRIGGWNVGIVGYLLDGRITNLDGLMNDQIFPYMRQNAVLKYVEDAGIEYLIDFPIQVEDRRLAEMCGYDARLRQRLEPVYATNSPNRADPWSDYTLYQSIRSCDARGAALLFISVRYALGE